MSLFLPVSILLASGLLAIASVAPALFYLQILWVTLGVGIVAAFYFFDWRMIFNYRWLVGSIYVLSLLLLVYVLLFAPGIRGTKGWIVLGPLTFQPVELAKIALILIFANYFARRHLVVARWGVIFNSFIYFAAPAVLVLLQPDLGSMLILFGIWFGFLFLSGLSGRRLLLAISILAAAAIVLWFYFLADYQKERIVGVFYPERDILGINYSATQSKIAIGSAGFWGKGFGQGSQSQLGFLTEPAGDFVLAVIVEEWGVFGGFIVIAAFLALIFGVARVGIRAERNFEKLVALGAAVVFILQFFLNGGSALGLTPVVGITFPFVSYGGSSMVMSFFLLGLVNAIRRQQI